MTKEEEFLVNEIREELEAMVRRYTMHIQIRDRLLEELKQLREENKLLKLHTTANGQCYFLQSGQILPFKHRG